jgi:hypothetical protein
MQDEEIQRRNDFDTLSTIEIHDRDQIKIRSTSIIVDHEHKKLARPRPKAEGAAPKGRNEMPNRLFHCHDRTGQDAECIETKNHWIKSTARW